MIQHGFLRVAAATPDLRIADCDFNAEQILSLMKQAQADSVAVLVFPELAFTGYTCADLFQQQTLLRGAQSALEGLLQASQSVFAGIAFVGLPLALDDQVFNCAAVIHRGQVLGLVPKSYLPNYKEFYERRWFAPAAMARSQQIVLFGKTVPFGTHLLFSPTDSETVTIGVEICEDLWVPIPPSSAQAVAGATVLVNLSASNEVIGKAAYRKQLVVGQSGRCMAAYVYSSCGVWESTTDVVFGGHCLIAENGTLLAESKRFAREPQLLVADIDLDRLRADRLRTTSFGEAQLYAGVHRQFQPIAFPVDWKNLTLPLHRFVDAHPFVPGFSQTTSPERFERCQEIFNTQVAGLARRLEQIGKPAVAIGISGGLDSTLALLVVCKTFDALGVQHDKIKALTMPGFGTTPKTLRNATNLMRQLKVSAREIDICEMCLAEMRALGHRPFKINLEGLRIEELKSLFTGLKKEDRKDVIFENIQARMRTSLLMNTGFVIGTGDVSEMALGWCTYNADHMSMYNPNSSIPKTLVKFLVEWAALNEFEGEARRTLLDIVATDISPELLPTDADGKIVHKTEELVGPYELHDFFLFHFLRYGASPEKILFLASQATFSKRYTPEVIRDWLLVFVERFFNNQFKRSCLPDGPKVGSISLSPRGDWRMPSDSCATLWLKWAQAAASS